MVLDPAHGGSDLGARGTEGIRESEVVLQICGAGQTGAGGAGFPGDPDAHRATRTRRLTTGRRGANAQRGAVFITLHIASTGLAGTVRTYVMPDLPPSIDPAGLIPWDRAQGPFVRAQP